MNSPGAIPKKVGKILKLNSDLLNFCRFKGGKYWEFYKYVE